MKTKSTMKQWNKSWKHHDIPKWMRKAIKESLKKQGKWFPWTSVLQELPRFFDHWGSIDEDGKRHMVSQPYSLNREEMAKFAESVGCDFTITPNAPYGHGTYFVVFYQP